MPARIFPYLLGLVQGVLVTTTSLECQFGFSHDKLTRTLSSRFVWETLVILVIQRLFGLLADGYLLLDDTVIAKPYAKKMKGASFVHSSLLDKVVFGYNIVFICWSNGSLTIPVAWRWYHKDGKTKIEHAIDLLIEMKNRWKLTPQYVLFDSFYAAEKLLNKLDAYHWHFVTRLKSNRIFSCAPIHQDLVAEGDSLTGLLTYRVKVTIVKHDEKYFCSNDLNLMLDEIISLYQKRWPIEEVFRFLKTELRLEKCQARIKQAQKTHLASCILVYLFIQKEQQIQVNQTLYSIRRSWQMNRRLGRNQISHYVKVLSA